MAGRSNCLDDIQIQILRDSLGNTMFEVDKTFITIKQSENTNNPNGNIRCCEIYLIPKLPSVSYFFSQSFYAIVFSGKI
jgi:hypothetical protein